MSSFFGFLDFFWCIIIFSLHCGVISSFRFCCQRSDGGVVVVEHSTAQHSTAASSGLKLPLHFSAPETVLLKDSGVMIPVVGGSFLPYCYDDNDEGEPCEKGIRIISM